MCFCMGNIFGNRKACHDLDSDYESTYYNEYKRLLDEKNKKIIKNMKLHKTGDPKYDPQKYNDVFYGAREQMSIINDLKNGNDNNVLFADSKIMQRRRLLRQNERNSTVENPIFDMMDSDMENEEKWEKYRRRRLKDKYWQESNSYFTFDPTDVRIFVAHYKRQEVEGRKRSKLSIVV